MLKENMRTPDEIEELINKAYDLRDFYKSKTYIDGILNTLEWVMGKKDKNPLTD